MRGGSASIRAVTMATHKGKQEAATGHMISCSANRPPARDAKHADRGQIVRANAMDCDVKIGQEFQEDVTKTTPSGLWHGNCDVIMTVRKLIEG